MIGGLKLSGKKETTLITWTIKRCAPAGKIYIPLRQADGTLAVPCVEIGSFVRVGQKIAAPSNESGLWIHASVSGTVTALHRFNHPTAAEVETLEIISDGRDEKIPGMGEERLHWDRLSSGEIENILRESGVLDLGLKMSSCQKDHFTHTQTLLLNGCESEPYVTADHALMMSHPLEILKGADLLGKYYGAKKIIIVVEDNKLEVAELLKSKIYFLQWGHIEIHVLPARYPQGSAESLRKHFSFQPPEDVRIQNIATAYAVYEAVVLNKPFYERVVTVGGECVMEPKNLWLRIGTLFEDAIKSCKGLMREPAKVLMGGPMSGIAQKHLLMPVIAGTQAILALPKEVAIDAEAQACTRCGLCVEACPAEISPVMITLSSERGLFAKARSWGLDQCFECGNCAYVCPSKRPMMELINQARFHLYKDIRLQTPTGPLTQTQKLQKKIAVLAEKDRSL